MEMIILGRNTRSEEDIMSAVEDKNCYFEGKRISSEEMVCLSRACMLCKDGKWEETHKIWVL